MTVRTITLLAILTLLLFPVSGFSAVQDEEGYVSSADGTRLFYKVVGKGPDTLVVLHGGPGNTMFSILPDFAPLAEKYRLIFYDQRGNGRSDLFDDPDKLALEHHIEDLEAIRKHFELDRMNLLGNSWGGLLASYYAIHYPDRIARLILHCAASPSYEHMRSFAPLITNRIPLTDRQRFRVISNPRIWLTGPDPHKICQEFYDILIPVYFFDQEKEANMRGDVCSGPVEAVRRQQAVNNLIWQSLGHWNILPELKSVTTPTLVIHASDDMIPVDSSRDWTRSFPNARLLVIEKAGHMSHVEQPDIFFRVVEEFLNNEWPAEAVKVSDPAQSE